MPAALRTYPSWRMRLVCKQPSDTCRQRRSSFGQVNGRRRGRRPCAATFPNSEFDLPAKTPGWLHQLPQLESPSALCKWGP
eukprot:3287103-Pyramimonas_sp.AAC.1